MTAIDVQHPIKGPKRRLDSPKDPNRELHDLRCMRRSPPFSIRHLGFLWVFCLVGVICSLECNSAPLGLAIDAARHDAPAIPITGGETDASIPLLGGSGGAGDATDFRTQDGLGSDIGDSAGSFGKGGTVFGNGGTVGNGGAGGTTTCTIVEFHLPTANSSPAGIAVGPDGNLWFTEYGGNKIGRITTTGTISEYELPTANSAPLGITAGSDGNLWFTEQGNDKIGRITPQGVLEEFSLFAYNPSPAGIAAGPDGNLWFTEGNGIMIGNITPTGALLFQVGLATPDNNPFGIASGPDGNLWLTDSSRGIRLVELPQQALLPAESRRPRIARTRRPTRACPRH
jgi:hypothetical protein